MSKTFQILLYVSELITAIPVLAVLTSYLYRRTKTGVISLFMISLYFLIVSVFIRTGVFLFAVYLGEAMTAKTIFVLATLWTLAHFLGIVVLTVFSFLVYRKKFDTFIHIKKKEGI
jgi:hypothetical protein